MDSASDDTSHDSHSPTNPHNAHSRYKMKLLLSLFPTLASLYIGLVVAAEECANVALTAIPGCAQNCILNGAPTIGCGGTDFDCQCAQSAALFAAVEGCVATACPSASYQGVIDGASTGKKTLSLIIHTLVKSTTGFDPALFRSPTLSSFPSLVLVQYLTPRQYVTAYRQHYE